MGEKSEKVDGTKDREGEHHDSSTIHGAVTAQSDLAQPSALTMNSGMPKGTQVNPIDDNDPAKKEADKVAKGTEAQVAEAVKTDHAVQEQQMAPIVAAQAAAMKGAPAASRARSARAQRSALKTAVKAPTSKKR